MADLRTPRPTTLIRAAPWSALLGAATAAAALLGLAVMARRTELVVPLTLLGLGACGGAAAYTLDEAAAEIADATPTSRPRRLGWRLTVVVVPGTVSMLGLLAVVQGASWGRTLPVALGTVAVGVATAAVLRRAGRPAPGDLAGPVALGVILLTVATDPLRRWFTLVPLGGSAPTSRTALAWGVTAGVCLLVVLGCERDPGRHARHRVAPGPVPLSTLSGRGEA